MVTLWWGSPRIARYGAVLSNAGRSPKSCLLGCSRCAAPVASSAPTSVEFQLRHPRRERSLAARPWSKPSFGWWHSTSFYISLPYSTIFCHVVPTLHIYMYIWKKQYNNLWKNIIDKWASLMSVGVSLMGTLPSWDLKAPCTALGYVSKNNRHWSIPSFASFTIFP